MKRSFLSATLVLIFAGGMAFAQAPQGPPPDGPRHFQRRPPSPEQEVKHLTRQLNLTPDQAARLEPIFANRDEQMKAIHTNGQLTQEAAREQMRSLQKTTQEQIAGILTPEQLQEMKADRRHGPRGPHGPGQWQGQQPPAL
jgi:Spy/CpxP family protein refolding chaperone